MNKQDWIEYFNFWFDNTPDEVDLRFYYSSLRREFYALVKQNKLRNSDRNLIPKFKY